VPRLIAVVKRPPRIIAPMVPAPGQPVVTNDQRPSKFPRRLVDGIRVSRISPRGDVDVFVDLPVDIPTCPAFGGSNLDTIKDSGSGRAVSKSPDGGSLIAVHDLGVRGLPEARFCFAFARGDPVTKLILRSAY
jgi:hypothetical protein